MLKRFTSLLLSLLLCLSLLPGQALASDESMSVDPPVIVELVEPEEPPVMLMAEMLDEKDTGCSGLD